MEKLEIKNLTVSIDEKIILKDFSLIINKGEIHAIMGPNGVGKSTLSKVIMGDENYKILSGEILVDGTNILNLKVNERANLGIFLAMQSPNEIEGVTNADFLRTALREKEKENFKLYSFVKDINHYVEKLGMNKDMIHRSLNLGFSGGEKKKNEILQMYILKPKFLLLDEIDSGLDMDSLKVVSTNLMEYYNEYKPAMLMITHYQMLLDNIKPDFVHIMLDGKIALSGDISLVEKIKQNGYNLFKNGTNELEEIGQNE